MNKCFRFLFILSMLGLLFGCETQPPKNGTTIDSIQKELEAANQNNASVPAIVPPAQISAALMPQLELDLAGGQEELERFDVRVSNADAREFFMGIVEGTPYNMVVHPDVSGTITLTLKNVTIPEVMMTLRDVYGYEFNQTPAGFQVLPVRLQSRIFYVDYLTLKRLGKSEMSINGGSSGESDTGSAGGASFSSIETSGEADIWTELKEALFAIIGNGEGRAITLSPQSGLIVVRAMPSELREVDRFLRESQASMQRQVIIEAKILEVQLDDGFRAGIDWQKVATSSRGGGRRVDLSQTSNFSTGIFTLDLQLADFTAVIDLLEEQGNTQVLSSPRVATLNNQKAVIKVGKDGYYITDIEPAESNDTTVTSPTPTFERFFSGIALDVTPQISRNDIVTLHIHPSVSEVSDEEEKQFTINGETQSLPLAETTIRESDNIVRARNGELIVIGGLMKEFTREELEAVPGAGDVPFFGSLFRNTDQSALKSELVILLKPVVIDQPTDWLDSMSDSASRFNSLDRGFHAGGSPTIFGTEGERQ